MFLCISLDPFEVYVSLFSLFRLSNSGEDAKVKGTRKVCGAIREKGPSSERAMFTLIATS